MGDMADDLAYQEYRESQPYSEWNPRGYKVRKTMQVQEYEITQFKPGDFTDQNGNRWCDAAFLGVSEPVKMVVKDPTNFFAGMKVYGRITDETSKANKPYLRFRREKRPEEQTQRSSNKSNYQPRDDMAIRAQWAIGQAVIIAKGAQVTTEYDATRIEQIAKDFFAMIDRVKNSDQAGAASLIPSQPVDIENVKRIIGAHAKEEERHPRENVPDWAPKDVREKFTKTEREEDEDIKSLLEQGPQG